MRIVWFRPAFLPYLVPNQLSVHMHTLILYAKLIIENEILEFSSQKPYLVCVYVHASLAVCMCILWLLDVWCPYFPAPHHLGVFFWFFLLRTLELKRVCSVKITCCSLYYDHYMNAYL